jgi:hypothetical protein
MGQLVPLRVGLFRLMSQMTQSMTMMTEQFGMTESDLDELKVRRRPTCGTLSDYVLILIY